MRRAIGRTSVTPVDAMSRNRRFTSAASGPMSFTDLPRTYSFPSGHSLFSFCFYGVLAGLLTRRIASRIGRILIWTFAALLVAAIGLSRIYLGVHYPSDVIAGYLAASLWVSTLVALDRVRLQRKNAADPGV